MADAIVVKYEADVKDLKKSLDEFSKRLDNLEKKSKKTTKDMEDNFGKASTSIVSGLKNIAAAAGVAFGVQQAVQLGKEMVTLAAKAEGVERAFKRIGGANSDNILQGLREATRGTVSDLQLMQRAVQASNFKIPLENLASLFKFAQARARETGESVEYLTDSIVLGIGRKSPLILDNLGISAVELRTRLKGVGVEAANVGDIAEIIGEIATEELAKMGDQADTTADRIEQITTALENMKVESGKAINEVINQLIKLGEQQGLIDPSQSYRDAIKFTNEYALTVERAADQIEDDRARELRIADQVNDKDAFVTQKKQERIELLKRLEQELAQVTSTETRRAEDLKLYFAEQALENAVGFDVFQRGAAKERIKEASEEIKANVLKEGVIKEQIKALKEILGLTTKIGSGGGETDDYVRSIAQLNTELKNLQSAFDAAEIGGVDFYRLADDIDAKIKEINLALRLLAERRFATQPDEEIPTFNITEIESQETATDDIIADYERRNDEIQRLIEERNSFEARLAEERRQKEAEVAYQVTQQTLSSVSSLVSSIAQIQQNAFSQEQEVLKQQLEEGVITREEFERKELEIRRKSAQANKDAAIFQAVIGTAQAVMQALANTPPPASYALAAVAGALGAAQIAAIASQPLPQFAEGGWVDGKGFIHGRSHKHGGVIIEAEGNEHITKGIQARKHAAILEAVNGDYWEKYEQEQIIAPAIEHILNSKGSESMGASYVLNGGLNAKDYFKGIDRNRKSQRDGFMYLGKKIDGLKDKRSRWN